MSWRLTRWAYNITMIPCPSVVVVVHTFKLEYLWSQLASLDKILCIASLGWWKGCIRFFGRWDQSSHWFIMGKTMSPPVLGCFLSDPAGDKDMHKISDQFEFRPGQTTDYGVSCPWASKIFPIDLEWENDVCMLAFSFLIKSLSKLLVTGTGIKARTSLILSQIRLLTLE